MNRRGVCYDVGRVMWGQDWRPEFSAEEARRELQIIRDDLHCNAVRICGQDLGRLMAAGGHALDCGLQVWLSPELWDHSPSDTVSYIAKAADAAEELHRHRPGQVVFSVGSEATLFMAGIVEGTSVFERLEHPDFWKRIKAGEHNGPLNVFLAEAAERAREVFHGPVTYASVPLETVEWSRFDFVSVDLYRGAELKDRFTDVLHRYFAFGRPVAITEFGCCTYRGAADAGGRGFAILDISAHDRDSTPPRLNGHYVRDEAEQARELTEMLSIFDAAGVDATFVMTFAAPLNPKSDDPLYDLDMASYSLVKSFGGRLGPLGAAHPEAPWDRSRLSTTYPGMPWEPKESFRAVAGFYTAHTPPAPYPGPGSSPPSSRTARKRQPRGQTLADRALDAAVAFFTELGMELDGKAQIEGLWADRTVGLDGVRSDIAMMRTPDGHSKLELTKYHTPAAAGADPENPPPNTLGLHRVMFAVDDIDDTVARLHAHGAELLGEVAQYESIFRLCYLRGPAGIIVALAEQIS